MPGKIKILVADDEESIVKLLDLTLTASGFSVFKTYSGHEAIETVAREHPDLVFLDISMPGMNGYEACEMLRKSPENGSLPIVMLTGKGGDSDIVQALEHGADGYVIKPFVEKELLNTIESLLGKAKAGKLPSQFYFEKMKPKPK